MAMVASVATPLAIVIVVKLRFYFSVASLSFARVVGALLGKSSSSCGLTDLSALSILSGACTPFDSSTGFVVLVEHADVRVICVRARSQ